MNFGEAIAELKAGRAVARAGWNGKGMKLWMVRGNVDYTRPIPALIGGVSHVLFDGGDEGTVTRLPNINMQAADGSIVVGWLASQTDMLAEDWQGVE